MIKPKTKKQKKHDQDNITESAKKCAEVCREFGQELYDSEFNIEWIRLGIISKMLETSNEYAVQVRRSNETHTFNSYEEDNKHELWDKSSSITIYE